MAESDPHTASQLFQLLYDELRGMAAKKLGKEKPGQTLQPTALVNEAYMRLVGKGDKPHWDNRGHFFVAAAEAMRRILVENARRKRAVKHGGGRAREEFDDGGPPDGLEPIQDRWADTEDLLALAKALNEFAIRYPRKAELVKLRYLESVTLEEAAEKLGVSAAAAKRDWTFARTWILRQITSDATTPPEQPV